MASSSQAAALEAEGSAGPGARPRACRSKAVALAQEILQLHEAHEELLAERDSVVDELHREVDSLSTRIRELEQENAELKRTGQRAGLAADEPQKADAADDRDKEICRLSRRNQELEKENAGLRDRLPKQAAEQTEQTEADDQGYLRGCLSEHIFLQEKGSFIQFVLAVAESGTQSREYKQMYQFLLKCFTDADNNFDGRVGFLEFETLIDAAAFLPRRFGYAPSTPELYSTDFDRVKQRMQLFKGLKPKRAKALNKASGTYDYISFDAWLRYAMQHIKEKATLLKHEKPHSNLFGTPEEVTSFIADACRSRKSQAYKELYHFVLKCFVDADTDMNGLIDIQGFNKIVEAATYAPRLQGFAPDASALGSSEEEKSEARLQTFKRLDVDATGFIGFDTWLEYIYEHICQKATELGLGGSVPDIEAAGVAEAEPKCPWRV